MQRAQQRGWNEQDIGLSIPRLPFLPSVVPPPCAEYRDTYALAAEDNRVAHATRNKRRAIVLAETTAKAVCTGCPVLQACKEYALDTRQQWGVWGGMSALERKAWRRTHPKGTDTVAPAGKFDDVPTIELFDPDALRVTRKDAEDGPRKKSVPSVAQGNCPNCLKQPAALVAQGPHWLWKAHQFKTWGGDTRECSASGVALCVAPEPEGRSYSGIPLHCPHGTEPVAVVTAAA
jgi:WhiB family redox-sensing transcriptional regulator